MANESVAAQIAKVEKNIFGVFSRRRVALIALSVRYAGVALKRFRQRQRGDEFWINRTGTAYGEVYGQQITSQDVIGFFMSHAVEYGVYLELANDRKHEAIRPVVFGLEKEFLEDVKKLMED